MFRKIPLEAREGYAINKAYEFLNESPSLSLPIDLKKQCEFHDYALMSYSELIERSDKLNAKASGVNINRLPYDGFAMILDGAAYILYNEKQKVEWRIRFTIAHEIGHLFLGHFDDFDLGLLRREGANRGGQYEVLEREADNFARNILTPFPLLNNVPLEKSPDWRVFFHITEQAAAVRQMQLNKDRNLVLPEVKNAFKEKFKNLIELPLHFKKCARCGMHHKTKNNSYCIFCGSEALIEKYPKIGDVNMIYPGFKVDENSKAINCPRCNNQEVHYGDNCIACGAFLINRCEAGWNFGDDRDHCDQLLPGNARYCFRCGDESTFSQNNFLEKWHSVKDRIEQEEYHEAEQEYKKKIAIGETPF